MTLWTLVGGLGCESSVTVDKKPGAPPEIDDICQSSLVCPEGERCDDGQCVPDDGCPPAVAPRELMRRPRDERAYVLPVDGQLMLSFGNVVSAEEEATTSTRFIRMADGWESEWKHALGFGSCSDELVDCSVSSSEGITLVIGLHYDVALGGWTPVEEIAVPEGWSPFRQAPDGGYIVRREPKIGYWDGAGTIVEPWLDLGARTLSSIVLSANFGRPRRIVSFQQDPGRWSVAPLEKGGTFEEVANIGQPYRVGAALLDVSDGYLVVHDVPRVDGIWVQHATESGTVPVGESPDPALLDVAFRYARAGLLLTDDRDGVGLGREMRTIRLVRADFVDVTTRDLATFTASGVEHVSVLRERWLSCDAVDVVLGAYDEDEVHYVTARLREGDAITWP